METSTDVTEQVNQSDEDVEETSRGRIRGYIQFPSRPQTAIRSDVTSRGFPRRQLAPRSRSPPTLHDASAYVPSPSPSPVDLISDDEVDWVEEPADDHDEDRENEKKNQDGNDGKDGNEHESNQDGASQMELEEQAEEDKSEEEIEQQRWKNILVSTLDELTARHIIPSSHSSTSHLMHFASTTTSCLSNTLLILSLLLLIIVLLIHLAMITHISSLFM